MLLFVLSLVAGVLTVLSPCTLTLLPVVVGSSLAGGTNWRRALTVTVALAISVVVATLALKVSASFVAVPESFWRWLSGGIIAFFALSLLAPELWERVPGIAKLYGASNRAVGEGYRRGGFVGDAIIGAALGPVFSSCSPTYFLLLATVLPASFTEGLLYLAAYAVGLAGTLFLVALLGQKALSRFSLVADPRGWFKRSLGILLFIIGIAIGFGFDKRLQTAIVEGGVFDITKLEHVLLERLDSEDTQGAAPNESGAENGTEEAPPSFSGEALPQEEKTPISTKNSSADKKTLTALGPRQHTPAPELRALEGYLNTEGKQITLAEYRGKKVVLLDFWTYSCINCQRTLPYLTAWYERYRDQGLEIIGIHTPEFSFEKLEENVQEALRRHGIAYPVVLDNQYGTWLAYGNRYWPRKYLIDIDGRIAYDHIGEGAYELTEKQIQHLLAERAVRLGEAATMPEGTATPKNIVVSGAVGSPEVYFGAWRNELLANGTPGKEGTQTLSLPTSYLPNLLYLGGSWNIEREYAASLGAGKIAFRFQAGKVYMVANAEDSIPLEVFLDGAPLAPERAGADVEMREGRAVLNIKADRLYHLLTIPEGAGEHTLELTVPGAGFRAFTFTFG